MTRFERGFVNHSLQWFTFALAIWAAITVPLIGSYGREKSVHRCALRLDAALADAGAERTCLLTEKPFEERDGMLCESSEGKERHRLKKDMCASPSLPAADSHPMPGLAWRAIVAAVTFLGLFALASRLY